MAIGSLISLSKNQVAPEDSMASDFTPTGTQGAAGFKSGQNQLIKQTKNQEGPRHTDDDGGPAVWGKVDGFAPSTNKGEANTAASKVKCDWGVDLADGPVTPDVKFYPM